MTGDSSRAQIVTDVRKNRNLSGRLCLVCHISNNIIILSNGTLIAKVIVAHGFR